MFYRLLIIVLILHNKCICDSSESAPTQSALATDQTNGGPHTEEPDQELQPELKPTAIDIDVGYCVLDNALSCGHVDGMSGETSIPCARPKRPQRLNDTESLDLLRELCPEFLDHDKNPLLCCGHEALVQMSESYELPKTLGLGRCPSCWHNWRKTFCHSTCSPRQSKFMTVTKTSAYEEQPELKKVDELDYYMKTDFARDMYDSCKGLAGLVPGSYIMDLMCGRWGSKKCNGFRWLEFMGQSIDNGGHAPFQINYIFSNEPTVNMKGKDMHPLNVTAIACMDAPPGEMACSCSDCEQSCKVENPPQLPYRSPPSTILNMSATTGAALIIYMIIVLSVFVYFAVYAMRNDNKSEYFETEFNS